MVRLKWRMATNFPHLYDGKQEKNQKKKKKKKKKTIIDQIWLYGKKKLFFSIRQQ